MCSPQTTSVVYGSHEYLQLQEAAIVAHYSHLVDVVDPHDVADVLYQLELLTRDDHEQVTNPYVTRRDRARTVLRVLCRVVNGVHGLVLAMTRTKSLTPLANEVWQTYKEKLTAAVNQNVGDEFTGVDEEEEEVVGNLSCWKSLLDKDKLMNSVDGGYSSIASSTYKETALNLHVQYTGPLHGLLDKHIHQCMCEYERTQAALPEYFKCNTTTGQLYYDYRTAITFEKGRQTPREHFANSSNQRSQGFHATKRHPDERPSNLSASYHTMIDASPSSSDDETMDEGSGDCGDSVKTGLETDDMESDDSVHYSMDIKPPGMSLPQANSYIDVRKQRWLKHVYDKVVNKINNGQYSEYYDLSRQILLTNPGDKDLQFMLLSAEAASLLFQNDNTKGQDVLGQALGTMGGTTSPSTALLDILSKQAWLHQQSGNAKSWDSVTSQATQLVLADKSTHAGTAAGWVYFNRARYLATLTGTPILSNSESKTHDVTAMALTHFEQAIDHFKQAGDSTRGEVLTTLTAMAMVLLGCGERLATVNLNPPLENVKRARAILSQVESSDHVPYNLRPYVQIGLCDYELRLGARHLHKAEQHAQLAANMSMELSLQEPLMMAQLRLVHIQSKKTLQPESGRIGECLAAPPEKNLKQKTLGKRQVLCEKVDTKQKQEMFSITAHQLTINSPGVKLQVDLASVVKLSHSTLCQILVCVLLVFIACFLGRYVIV